MTEKTIKLDAGQFKDFMLMLESTKRSIEQLHATVNDIRTKLIKKGIIEQW